MNLAYIKHEFSMILTNKKNIIFLLFVFAFILSYCFVLLPNTESIESYDSEKVNHQLQEIAATQKERESRGATGIIQFTGTPLYALHNYELTIQSNMITALEDSNYRRFVHLRTHYLERNRDSFFQNNRSLFVDSPFPGKDLNHLYQKTLMRYQHLLQSDIPITYSMVEEKTAVQTLQNILLSSITYFIIFCAIYFSCDVLTRDRQNRSVLHGLPLSWYGIINMKTIVAFTYTLLVLIGLFLTGFIIIGMMKGFGSLQMQMPIMISQRTFRFDDYDMITIGQFFLQSMTFIPICAYLFVRLNMMLSLLLKNQWLVLIISSLALFSERIYFSRTTRELWGFNISNFPQTYFDFGKVVAGEKNFLVNVETLTFSKGVIVLLITIIVIELLLFITIKVINKRRFFK